MTTIMGLTIAMRTTSRLFASSPAPVGARRPSGPGGFRAHGFGDRCDAWGFGISCGRLRLAGCPKGDRARGQTRPAPPQTPRDLRAAVPVAVTRSHGSDIPTRALRPKFVAATHHTVSELVGPGLVWPLMCAPRRRHHLRRGQRDGVSLLAGPCVMHRCSSAVDVVPCSTASPIYTDSGRPKKVAMYSVAKNRKPFELRPGPRPRPMSVLASASETASRWSRGV
jgi:hypothetical protein